MNGKVRVLMNGTGEDISIYKRPTFFMDSDHESITGLVSELIADTDPPEARARKVFDFVRNDIQYEFGAKIMAEEYVASNILKEGRGYCVQKAILLCALGRAAGLAVALMHSDIRDHTLPERFIKLLQTNVMYDHGLNAFYLNDKFIMADATLSPDVIEKRGYRKIDFDPHKDCLLPATTPDQNPHVEYLKFHGLFAEFDHGRMVASLMEHYSHKDWGEE